MFFKRAESQLFERVLNGFCFGFWGGEFDEDGGVFANDDGGEHLVVGARGFGAAEGRAIEVGAGGGEEDNLGAVDGLFFTFDLWGAFELADPAVDVGIDGAALAGAEVVEDGFERVALFRWMFDGGFAHHAGVLGFFPRGRQGEIEFADGDFGGGVGLAESWQEEGCGSEERECGCEFHDFVFVGMVVLLKEKRWSSRLRGLTTVLGELEGD